VKVNRAFLLYHTPHHHHHYDSACQVPIAGRTSLSLSLSLLEAGTKNDSIIMSQPGGAPQPASAYPPDMIRPEKIAGIPMLSAESKVTYTEGLTKLWTALEANPRGSDTHNKATAKIKEVSREIMRHITHWKANNQNQQQRAQSQAQVPQLPQQQQQQAPPQQQAQPTPQQQQPVPQQQTQQPAMSNPPPQQQPQQQQHHPQPPQQQIPQQQQPQQQQVPQVPGNFPLGPQAKAFLGGFKVFPPTNIIPNTPDYENYKRRIMTSLTRLVTMQESSVSRFQQTHEKISQLEAAGQTATPDLVSAREAARMGVQDAKNKIDGVRNDNEKNRMAWADKSKAPQQNNSQTPMPQQQVASPYNPTAQANNSGQAMSPVPANPYQQQSNVPLHPQQQQQQQQQPQQPIARPPNQQQPYQSPAPQGQPQALSHADAINQAQRNYSQQGTGTPTSQSGNQAFNHTQQTALNVGNPKFPIPKNLPTSGTHNPVPLGPARPTFGGPSNGAPGMMGQPAVQKTPHFILEGEGDRVLSKKKLDELVRQVTGGGEGDGLTPDVEESVLTLADDFVDSVITAACRLAKIRPNSTLDIRDIQIILERNYNIRVPGYSLDEVRTVRKFQPAPGWTQKMNAVQAAKVMGKNDA
jgi:transcription initiation factor TFIID subunit 12